MTTASDTGRVNQKKRTRMAILQACRDVIRSGGTVTMPDVARLALVSEATAYRYFPDLASLVNEAFAGLWPAPADALGPVADRADPVERVAFACEFLLRGVLSAQTVVRGMIAATITRPELASARPGIRFGLIDEALAHLEGRIEFVTTQGDHDIVVVAAEYVVSHHGAPLVFYRGGFGGFS